MTCLICRLPCPPPARPYAVTDTGRIHYLDAPDYDRKAYEAALAHLPVIHEICGRLKGWLDRHGRIVPGRCRGILIRCDERLRA